MSLDETLNIATPENVSFDYDIAGIGSRFIANLLDTMIILILQFVTNLLLILILSSSNIIASAGTINDLSTLNPWVIALVGLVSFLFLWGYYIFFEMIWNGQTPGKRAVHLRVIRADGTPITLTELIVRNLVRLVDFLPAFYGIGTLAVFINRQTRRLGDLAAGTLVVREKNQQVTLKELAQMHSATRSQAAAAPLAVESLTTYPVNRLSYQDTQMIESFFQRKSQFTNHGALAKQLLTHLLAKMDAHELYDGLAPEEAALKKILHEYRQYHQQK